MGGFNAEGNFKMENEEDEGNFPSTTYTVKPSPFGPLSVLKKSIHLRHHRSRHNGLSNSFFYEDSLILVILSIQTAVNIWKCR